MVISFIEQFKPARDLFLNGMCYWFAIILVERFDGVLLYDHCANHFLAWIDGKTYDASGDVTYEYPQATVWEIYEGTDPIHADRIRAHCILKIKDRERE